MFNLKRVQYFQAKSTSARTVTPFATRAGLGFNLVPSAKFGSMASGVWWPKRFWKSFP